MRGSLWTASGRCSGRVPCRAPYGGGRRGYVLLLVLLVLLLAAVSLGAACRATLRQSAGAAAAVADLQHRWGAVTAQYALLTDAANVLDRAEVPGGPPVGTLHGSFALGRLRFDVDVCDEQAKANVNALLAWRRATAAAGLIRDLSRAGGGRLAPRMAPAAVARGAGPLHALPAAPTDDADNPADTADRVPAVFGCLTEVFPGAGWDDLRPSSPTTVSTFLTVYGSGQVNVRRASAAVLAAACGRGLSPAQSADLSRRARSAGLTFDVPSAVAATGATPTAAAAVVGRLVDGSFAQSVWVTATDGRRTWRSWAVRDATDAEHPRTFTGAW